MKPPFTYCELALVSLARSIFGSDSLLTSEHLEARIAERFGPIPFFEAPLMLDWLTDEAGLCRDGRGRWLRPGGPPVVSGLTVRIKPRRKRRGNRRRNQ
jgi:hypothetical protein